jgi:hypothetical protein
MCCTLIFIKYLCYSFLETDVRCNVRIHVLVYFMLALDSVPLREPATSTTRLKIVSECFEKLFC